MTRPSFYLSPLVGLLAVCGAAPSSRAADAAPSQPCVEVKIGQDKAGLLDCLNEQLRQTAQRQQPVQPAAPYGTNSPPTQIGIFNESAEKERLGSAFGHSVQPQRPAH